MKLHVSLDPRVKPTENGFFTSLANTISWKTVEAVFRDGGALKASERMVAVTCDERGLSYFIEEK